MIIIVSNARNEAAALAALCATRSWACHTCASVVEFRQLSARNETRVVVTRHRLSDGYSDDIFSLIRESGDLMMVKSIVLAAANLTIQQEARQIALGADSVLRDPVRLDVLIEYLAKFRVRHTSPTTRSPPPEPSYPFAGARLFPRELRIERHGKHIQVTPREMDFLQILARAPGKVVTYSALYSELFGRTFCGDTANMRVLWGKTVASFLRLNIDLRRNVQVIPKMGYQHLAKTPFPSKDMHPKSLHAK